MNNERDPCCKLIATVVEGRRIKSEDPLGESDPFVEVYLSKSYQQKVTQVIEDDKNPKWNQQFTFDVKLGDDIIYFNVNVNDLADNDAIGGSRVELKKVFVDGKFDEWIELRAIGSASVTGEIHVIMSFEPS